MKNRFFILVLTLCIASFSFAQDFSPEESEASPLSRFQYFKLDATFGGAYINGDLFLSGGVGYGMNAEYSFGRFFSLRAFYARQTSTGLNFYPSQVSDFNSRAISDLEYDNFVYNYLTKLNHVGIEPMFTLKNQKIRGYIGLGPNFNWYKVIHDALDENGSTYDFTPLITAISNRGDVSRDDLAIVRDILDGEYETLQLTDKLFEASNSLGISTSLGLSYYINKNVHLGAELRSIFTFQDNLDGYRDRVNNTTNDDIFYLNVLAGYTFGQ